MCARNTETGDKKMRLREIQKQRPDTFKYRGKEFSMVFYSMRATHNKQISDEIVWESEDGTTVNYVKGDIYAQNSMGGVFAEITT